jgi:CRISPR system Cascade subunit CasC
MTEFLQLHLLTAYPPSNLNRDDLGKPKTANVGGSTRIRVSSQSLKRAWRTSEIFSNALAGHVGTRTKLAGRELAKRMVDLGATEAFARECATVLASQLGKAKAADEKKKPLEVATEQLVHLSPEEMAAIEALAAQLAKGTEPPSAEQAKAVLTKTHKAVDIALFGRMLADSPDFNQEAAAQVAHAFTVHRATVEDDYFSAVDDLNTREEDLGAGHIGELGFGAGLFYLYLCINRDLLRKNLQGDEELTGRAIAALVEAAAKEAPRGKQASFASRARASYILAERGSETPRSLSVAFLRGIEGADPLALAIETLRSTRQRFADVYGAGHTTTAEIDVTTGTGSFAELQAFAAQPAGS